MTAERPSPATTNPTVVSRRDLLRAAALGGLAAFLAACGSSQTPAPSPTTSSGASLPATAPAAASSAPSPSVAVRSAA
ncbi:MAG TPA: twin-arginine translocation signal domain-containing protein, partial [Candidatus Limnocylindrales bacterium]